MSSLPLSVADDLVHLRRARAWNATQTIYPRHAALTDLFQAQVEQHGTRPAVAWEGGELSYRELWDHSLQLAHVLIAAGVAPGARVATTVPRSANGLIALWAILLAGGAYLPIDPHNPPARIATLLSESGAGLVIIDRLYPVTLPAGIDAVPVDATLRRVSRPLPHHVVDADAPAYVIQTSGSTGTPRGVMMPHRGPVRLVCGARWLTLTPQDVLLATTSFTFDVSTFEIFGALLTGARLVLPTTDLLLSPPDLEALIVRERVSVMWLSAGLFHQTAGLRPELFRHLRCFIAGGDALNPASVRAVLATGGPTRFLNGYGPTENACFSTTHRLAACDLKTATSVPIGRPIENSTAWVVQDCGRLAAIEQEGELWVGGDGVAHGYHQRPELTADRFVPDRFSGTPGRRLYRTGDMARWRSDGVLEFLGRRDRQVKVRGFRVELREIEHVLMAAPTVRAAVVVMETNGVQADTLQAWVVQDDQHDDERGRAATLRRYLQDRLPSYMVPATVHIVDRLPLNSHGKVERAAMRVSAPLRREVVDPPGSETEAAIAELWQTMLDVPSVGRQDDFFTLGGQSLQATQMAAAIRRRLTLPATESRSLIQALLESPTLAEYARLVDRLRTATVPLAIGRGAHIDFDRESQIDAQLDFSGPRAGDPQAPRSVLLTGASGFLGVYLLDRLARAGVKEVICLVRAATDRAAGDRLAGRMHRFGLDIERVADVVRPLAGDLTQPRFGLSDAQFSTLATRVEVIVHAGSHVNFAYPYDALRAANVGGTATILHLASQHTVKPVHYVSTIAVIAGCGVSGIRYVDERDPLRHPDRICLGYPESKWVAERMIHRAVQRGLPATIYRPYEITGTRDRAIWNTDTMMCALFRTIAESGLSPDIPLPLDFVPVDFTAEAIVHTLTARPPAGRVLHLTNPHDARLSLLDERLAAMGYQVQRLPYHTWVARLADLTAADPRHPMAPYLPMFAEQAGASDLTVKEMYFAGTFPTFGRSNFLAATADANLSCPPVDAAMLDAYLAYFVDSGFLRAASLLR